MRRILLADDGPAIQKMLRLTFLDHPDFEVDCVGNGDEAIERIRDAAPDVLLADVHMPGASGYEVCRELKRTAPESPVLLLVGNLESFDEESAKACRADGHLRKPFDGQELLRRIGEIDSHAQKTFARTAPIPIYEGSKSQSPTSKESLVTEQVQLSDEQVDRIARRVVELLTDDQVRKIAWEVVPDMAEVVVRDRIRELETQVEEL